MKKIALFSRYDIYNRNNNIFDSSKYVVGENLEYPLVLLREYLKSEGIAEVSTIDIGKFENLDIIIFLDFPTKENIKILENAIRLKIKVFLVTLESPIICPENFETKNLKKFNKVFTWKEEIVDGENIIWIGLPNKIPSKIIFEENKDRKLLTMIAGNKKVTYIGELYSEREKAIKWFEKNASHDFDLYGFGWIYKIFRFPISAIVNRISILQNIFKLDLKVYKGSIENKLEVLKDYKFSICYENVLGYNGYISEKIFDCFFCGVIPVYLGSNGINKYIPDNVYIDKNKFKTYQDLYLYLKTMPDEEYIRYITAIRKFVEEDRCGAFNAEKFVDKVSIEIKK